MSTGAVMAAKSTVAALARSSRGKLLAHNARPASHTRSVNTTSSEDKTAWPTAVVAERAAIPCQATREMWHRCQLRATGRRQPRQHGGCALRPAEPVVRPANALPEGLQNPARRQP